MKFKRHDRVEVLTDGSWKKSKVVSFVFHSPITREDYYELKVEESDLLDFYPESQIRKIK